MIGNEIEKRNQFREQSVPILSQIEVQEIETAHKSVVSPCVPPCLPLLVQTGGQTQVFTSTNGRDWDEPLMILSTIFDDQSRVGLFVCSGNTFAATTAVFDTIQDAR